MTVYDIFQLIAGLCGTIGSIMCCLGAASMKDEAIQTMSVARHGPHPTIIKSMCEQRAQYIAGAVYFVLGSALFTASIAFSKNFSEIEIPGRIPLIGVTVFLALLLLCATFLYCRCRAKKRSQALMGPGR